MRIDFAGPIAYTVQPSLGDNCRHDISGVAPGGCFSEASARFRHPRSHADLRPWFLDGSFAGGRRKILAVHVGEPPDQFPDTLRWLAALRDLCVTAAGFRVT